MSQRRRSLGSRLDLAQVLPHRRPPGLPGRAVDLIELPADECCVVDDHRQRVVEVVGDAPGEPAQALEPLAAPQVAVTPLNDTPVVIGLHRDLRLL